MGAWQSTLQNAVLGPSNPGPSHDSQAPRTTSPPHPSRSDFTSTSASTRPRPRNALSYFLSAPTSDLIHSHSTPSITDVERTISILSRKLPPELVSRVVDESRYWAGCRNLLKKEIEVVSAEPGMRRLPRVSGWTTGQEEVAQGGLEDKIGGIWYLVSEEVGCEKSQGIANATGRASDDSTSEKPVASVSADTKRAADLEEKEDEEEDEEEEGCWIREIVIETLSKDQGWSSALTANPALYGVSHSSFLQVQLI